MCPRESRAIVHHQPTNHQQYPRQAAASAQALAPKGPTQMTLTAAFSRKGSGGAAAESMDIDDD